MDRLPGTLFVFEQYSVLAFLTVHCHLCQWCTNNGVRRQIKFLTWYKSAKSILWSDSLFMLLLPFFFLKIIWENKFEWAELIRVRLARAHWFHTLGQDQSTVAKRAETTVDECSLTSEESSITGSQRSRQSYNLTYWPIPVVAAGTFRCDSSWLPAEETFTSASALNHRRVCPRVNVNPPPDIPTRKC